MLQFAFNLKQLSTRHCAWGFETTSNSVEIVSNVNIGISRTSNRNSKCVGGCDIPWIDAACIARGSIKGDKLTKRTCKPIRCTRTTDSKSPPCGCTTKVISISKHDTSTTTNSRAIEGIVRNSNTISEGRLSNTSRTLLAVDMYVCKVTRSVSRSKRIGSYSNIVTTGTKHTVVNISVKAVAID